MILGRPLRTRRRPTARWVPCKKCQGFGYVNMGKLCGTCRGFGQIWVED